MPSEVLLTLLMGIAQHDCTVKWRRNEVIEMTLHQAGTGRMRIWVMESCRQALRDLSKRTSASAVLDDFMLHLLHFTYLQSTTIKDVANLVPSHVHKDRTLQVLRAIWQLHRSAYLSKRGRASSAWHKSHTAGRLCRRISLFAPARFTRKQTATFLFAARPTKVCCVDEPAVSYCACASDVPVFTRVQNEVRYRWAGRVRCYR